MANANAASLDVHATVRTSRLGVGWEAPGLMLITITLLSIGLVSVYSASAVLAQSVDGRPDYFFVLRQLSGGAVGLVALVAMAQLDYRHLRIFAWPVLVAVVLALLIVVVPGTEAIAPTR